MAAAGVLLAVVVVPMTTQDRLPVEASADLLGGAGTFLLAGGVVLNYFTDFVIADRRFTVRGLRVAAPWLLAGILCLGGAGYLVW